MPEFQLERILEKIGLSPVLGGYPKGVIPVPAAGRLVHEVTRYMGDDQFAFHCLNDEFQHNSWLAGLELHRHRNPVDTVCGLVAGLNSLGYQNFGDFSRFFKTQTGHTPSEQKAMHTR